MKGKTVTLPPHGLLTTGLYWHAGSPALGLIGPTGVESQMPLPPGTSIGWQLRGPRRCIGIWLPTAGRRRMCPYRAAVAGSGPQAQCPACAGADPGRALARDAAVDDPRTFALYLAWFGTGLLKVGLTAIDRGTNRLAEQGALAFTWLGYGPLLAVRRAERAASATGTVRERLPRHAKIATWWRLGALEARREQLTAAHQHLSTAVAWPDGIHRLPCQVHDLTGMFGLGRPVPQPTEEITAVGDGTVLAGRLACLAGRDAVLDTADGPLLIDLRLLAGWVLIPADGPAAGFTLTPLTLAGSSDDHAQGVLF